MAGGADAFPVVKRPMRARLATVKGHAAQGPPQCCAVFATAPAVGRDAARPSGGTKTGTIKAERIINTATPTSTSTNVMCQFRLKTFIGAFLSFAALNEAIQIPERRNII